MIEFETIVRNGLPVRVRGGSRQRDNHAKANEGSLLNSAKARPTARP